VLNKKGDLVDGFHRIIAAKLSGKENINYVFDDGSFDVNEPFEMDVSKNIAAAYHAAKADGSNPELVKAVEDLLAPNNNSLVLPTPKNDVADIGSVIVPDVSPSIQSETQPTAPAESDGKAAFDALMATDEGKMMADMVLGLKPK
jgi:hypothetical protein